MVPGTMKPIFFPSPSQMRDWLAKHHATKAELEVGYHKRATGKPSLTWPESVDEALCFGWIDGVRHGIDATRYRIRFTPRKATSIWSNINTKRFLALRAEGRVQPAGEAAFSKRKEKRAGLYAFEQATPPKLKRAQQQALKADPEAWDYFRAQAAWYQRTAVHWVVSAKQEATRARRLEILIRSSRARTAIPPLVRPVGKS